MADKKPHPVDIHAGKRLRELRCLAGLTQTALADSVHLTFQQIQKYEAGTNRMAASRLWDFAGVFKAPVESFFPTQAGALSRGRTIPPSCNGCVFITRPRLNSGKRF